MRLTSPTESSIRLQGYKPGLNPRDMRPDSWNRSSSAPLEPEVRTRTRRTFACELWLGHGVSLASSRRLGREGSLHADRGSFLVLVLAALPAIAQHDDRPTTPSERPREERRNDRPPARDHSSSRYRSDRHRARPRLDRRLQRPIDRDFTDKTIAGMKAFQRNRKWKEAGELNPQERAALAAAAKAKQAQVGWSMVDDASGRGWLPSSRCRTRAPARPEPAGPRRKGR